MLDMLSAAQDTVDRGSLVLGVAFMCKRIGVVVALVASLGFIPLAQASVLYDFESPAYSLGTLDSQNGWIAGGSSTVPNPAVVAKPSAMPSSAGSQSAEIGWYSDHYLTGAGFGDMTSVSFLMQYNPTGSATEIAIYAGGLTTPDVIARLHISGNNNLSFGKVPGTPGVTQFATADSTDTKVWQVQTLLDFGAQQYKSIWTDLSTSTAYDSGWTTLLASRTAGQTEANSYFSIGALGGQGTGGQVFDNLSVSTIPEPTSITMLVLGLFGLLAYAWRKRK
jgi:hypothetical protein